MTPKEKAQELFDEFYGKTPTRINELDLVVDRQFAKECALIAVNEILNNTGCGCCNQSEKNYWNQVKQEIQNL